MGFIKRRFTFKAGDVNGVKTGFVGCMNNLDLSHYLTILIIFIIPLWCHYKFKKLKCHDSG